MGDAQATSQARRDEILCGIMRQRARLERIQPNLLSFREPG